MCLLLHEAFKKAGKTVAIQDWDAHTSRWPASLPQFFPLVNLLDNAIKHSPAGSTVEIGVESPPISRPAGVFAVESALRYRLPSVALLGSLFAASCLAQSPAAAQHINQLIEHWRWEQYWKSSTDLGPLYRTGREFQALLFWHADSMFPGVGFCSADLGICLYDKNQPAYDEGNQTKILAGDDEASAFTRFRETAFGDRLRSLISLPVLRESDYPTEPVKIVLPSLDPPKAIRDRNTPDQGAIDDLVKQLTGDCGPRCKVHLLIPYFNVHDSDVPIYFACSGCKIPKTIVRAMWGGDDVRSWWIPISSWGHDPADVKRTRALIEKALMLEVNPIGANKH